MFVTTIERTTEELNDKAREISNELKLPFVIRNRVTIKKLMSKYQSDCLVTGNDLVLYSFKTGKSVFFHPNLAQVRLKRILKGETDAFLEASMIDPGDHILDCTLGFASDAIIASHAVGENGFVTGLEKSPIWAYVLKNRLKKYETDLKHLKDSLNRIACINADYNDFLKKAKDKSYDIVYFDPMFEYSIEESSGLQSLKNFANFERLTKEAIIHASRVARKRVVLKSHFQSSLFEELGFKVIIRKTSKFHFGIINVF